MLVTGFTNTVFAMGDIDLDIRDLVDVPTKVVTGKQLVEGNYAKYNGVEVADTAATFNEDTSAMEFTVDLEDTIKANFTTNATQPITFAVYVDGIKVSDLTLTGGTQEFILENQLPKGEYTFKLERTTPASAGSVELNSISLIYGNVLEVEADMLGDVNGDEKLNLDDVVLMAQYIAGWSVKLNLDVANIDGQPGITLDDVVLLAQYLAGWDVKLVDPGLTNYPAVETRMENIAANLKLTGRAGFDNNLLRMDWSHSGFAMQGQLGGDIVLTKAIQWQDTLYYCVIDNDVENKREVIVRGTSIVGDVTIVKNLKPGYHTIQFFKATEANVVTFEGIKYNGTLDAPPAEKSKVIQFIGDSVTCGSGITNAANNTPEAVYRSNISQSFGFLTAQHFNAEFRVQSISGGSFSYFDKKPYMYDRYFNKYVSGSGPAHDFSAETQPDVVVIALGTNDAGIDADTVTTYSHKMLDMVREKHPNAKIVWFYGMMGTGLKASLKAAVEAYAVNDSNVYYCQGTRNDCSGFNGHPVASAHQIGANELIAFMESNNILY